MDIALLVLLLIAAVVIASWAWRGMQQQKRRARMHKDRAFRR